MIKIRVLDEKVQRNLSMFASQLGKAAGPLIANEARLWCLDAIEAIPPVGIGKAAQNVGKDAVNRDIGRRGFPSYEVNQITSDAMLAAYERAVNEGPEPFNRMSEKLGNKSRAVRFSPSMHRGARNKVGRIPKRNITQYLVTGADKSARDAHIKAKQKNVGMMKAAFAWCADKASAASKMTGRRVPKWIDALKDKGKAWMATDVRIKMAGAKTRFEIQSGAHGYAISALSRAMATRGRALARKARNLALGKAAIIDGKYKILKSDRGDK